MEMEWAVTGATAVACLVLVNVMENAAVSNVETVEDEAMVGVVEKVIMASLQSCAIQLVRTKKMSTKSSGLLMRWSRIRTSPPQGSWVPSKPLSKSVMSLFEACELEQKIFRYMSMKMESISTFGNNFRHKVKI